MVPQDIMEQMRHAFRAEALDLLIELDSALLALETEPGDVPLVHRVFRVIHTIKGSGATAGCVHLARFAHGMEGAFDLAREGRLAVSPELIDYSLRACDVLRLILNETDGTAEGGVVSDEIEVAAAFSRMLPEDNESDQSHGTSTEPAARQDETRTAFEIIFKPSRELFYSGADPVTLLDDLRELGSAHITAHVDQVPPLSLLEAEQCYLWWDILLVTTCDQAAVKDVFVFVEDECEIRIHPREDQAASVALFGSVPAEMFELFLMECEEHLKGMESDAVALEKDPASSASLDSLFRHAHSIKGCTALLWQQIMRPAPAATHPLHMVLRIAHGLESQLDTFRDAHPVVVDDETLRLVFDTREAIAALLVSLTRGPAVPVSPELLERLGAAAPDASSGQKVDAREAAFLNTLSQCVEMIADCLRRFHDPGEPATAAIAIYLRSLKTLSAAARYRECPELDEPITTQLEVLQAALLADAPVSAEDQAALATAFTPVGWLLDRLRSESSFSGGAGTPVKMQASAGVDPSETRAERAVAASPASTIRIDQSKLDRLMTIVGELLVARGAFPLLIQKINNEVQGTPAVVAIKDLKETEANISRIADELQSSVMSIRMLPVKTVFQRFPRLVRDLARTLGKEVRMVVEGESIELDKTIIEQIGDPLVHIIRNAVDHGLEMPEGRRAAGKDPSGLVTLKAQLQSGGILIEVSDDGRGLDAAALRKKAVEKGLVSQEAAAAMSDEAAYQLVFLPGLSTAAKLTDVSGRGVGMDVVQSNVRNLQGTIEIRSKLGAGTTFLIRLPTSLMVSKGILMEAGAQQYILPLSNIRDMVKLPLHEAHQFGGLTMAQVRGTIYPIFSLAEMLGLAPAKTSELSIAIVEASAAKYGLVVDRFLTEVEVLVKPLTGGLEQCREFQGAAIMGDGRVVLVLNALECHSLDQLACS